MKLFITILKLTIIFIKLTKKKRMISPKPMGRPPSRAERPVWRARRVEEGDVGRPERRIIECFRMKSGTNGWRHKSVGDPSRRVWKATTPAFRGLTTGSRIHRSCYENGDERHNRFVPPSVISGLLSMKTDVKSKAVSTPLHYNKSWMIFIGPFVSYGEASQKQLLNTYITHFVYSLSPTWKDEPAQDQTKNMKHRSRFAHTISVLSAVLVINHPEITEGGTNWLCRSSPFS